VDHSNLGGLVLEEILYPIPPSPYPNLPNPKVAAPRASPRLFDEVSAIAGVRFNPDEFLAEPGCRVGVVLESEFSFCQEVKYQVGNNPPFTLLEQFFLPLGEHVLHITFPYCLPPVLAQPALHFSRSPF
jgi:hypothetical protein